MTTFLHLMLLLLLLIPNISGFSFYTSEEILSLCAVFEPYDDLVQECSRLHKKRPPPNALRLFVFGDSYADTGNLNKSDSFSWMEPYGITFPGKPVGRFSDGRILTDYVASFYGLKTPMPYEMRKDRTKFQLNYGMNFAYGGSGVFNTIYLVPNITDQINNFENVIEQNVYTKYDLQSSIALISLAGNDYTTFIVQNGNYTMKDFRSFQQAVIKQLASDIKRISDLGVGKTVVTDIGPLGCLPTQTASVSYRRCNASGNVSSKYHNKWLREAVRKLNAESGKSLFMVLDMYDAFISAFKRERQRQRDGKKTWNPLKPCCVGMNSSYSCGSVNEKGEKKYLVCDDPNLSVFFDEVHPSQNGWHSIYLALQPQLQRIKP